MKKMKVEIAEGHSSSVITKFDNNESQKLKKKKKKKKNNSKFKKIQDSEISSTAPDIKEEILSPDEIKQEKVEVKEETVPYGKKASNTDMKNQLSTLWVDYKPRSTTYIKSGEDWSSQLVKEYPEKAPCDPNTKKELKQIAAKILEQDVEIYKKIEEKQSRKGDKKFRKQVYNMGTSRDKLAANVLRCMEAPVHSLHHLNSIIAMVSPKAKNELEEVIKSLIQLLETTFLPENRVARKFEDHKFSCLIPMVQNKNREKAEKQLGLWYFEDQLNFAFKRLISQLKLVASDTVDKTKNVGIQSLANLVKNHPGQDPETVLEIIINKLGDPSRKVASQSMFYLKRLLEHLPALKNTVVNVVELLLFRPNVAAKSQYFCLCYMKDMVFKRGEQFLASKLIKLYIGFFKACTKKGDVDTRMMGVLLRGINRAFPYSNLRGDALHEQLETLYKLCHVVNFNTATQALQLIYQVVTSNSQVEDRFYQALYRLLLDPTFGASLGNAAFLNLIFKAMMRDDSVERRQAFIKRVLQVAQNQGPHLMCGMLFLVSEIIKEKSDMRIAVQKVLHSRVQEEVVDDDFETFDDVEDEDESPLEEGDVKSEDENEVKDELNDSKEVLLDLLGKDSKDFKPPDLSVPVPTSSSWFHQSHTTKDTAMRRDYYDPYARNPLYCGAQFSPLWELIFLKSHFHPTVSLFADKIVNGDTVDYSGDPMQDFTLIRFLDRFVYKNPKKVDRIKSDAVALALGSKAGYCPDGTRGVAVNTNEFIALEGDNVPEDQRFFHNYFKHNNPEKKRVKEEDEESIGDDEFDDYMKTLGGGFKDEDEDEELDFAAGATGKRKDDEGMDDEDSDDDDDEDMSDDEPDFEGDDQSDARKDNMDFDGDDDEFDGDDDGEFGGDDEDIDFDDGDDDDLDIKRGGNDEDELDFDEEGVEFSDDDDDFPASSKKGGKSKKLMPKNKDKGSSLGNMFASADDFSHLLEDTADEDIGATTSKAMANTDKAHSKQIVWEVERNKELTNKWKGNRGQKKPLRGGGGFENFGGNKEGQKKARGSRGGQRSNKGHNKMKSGRGRGSFKARRGGKRK